MVNRAVKDSKNKKYEIMGNNPANLYKFAGLCIFMGNNYGI
jgi:hypothetical protein